MGANRRHWKEYRLGGKVEFRIRKLVNAGMTSLSALATSTLRRLQELGGLSEKRAQTRLNSAREILKVDSRKDAHQPAAFVRTKPANLHINVDPYRLRRALELKVLPDGAGFWTVTGGLEPHRVLDEYADLSCNCHDHAKGHVCKHMLAVRLYCGDPELRSSAEFLEKVSDDDHLDLFALWFERSWYSMPEAQRHLETAHGVIRYPAYIPVTRFGKKYPLDALIQPYLPRLSQAVMVSYHDARQMKQRPRLPLLIDSGGFAALFEGTRIVDEGGLGVLEIPTNQGFERLHPMDVLDFQEQNADVAFTLDFPIPP
jgi:hypothetical protein